MTEKPIYENNIINVSLENIMRILKENNNSDVNEYLFAVFHFLETTEIENSALRAENKTLKDMVETLKYVICVLSKNKGENNVKD